MPPEFASEQYRNIITGEVIRSISLHGDSWILVGEAFATLPVALLVREV
jgi:hypothetical protein